MLKLAVATEHSESMSTVNTMIKLAVATEHSDQAIRALLLRVNYHCEPIIVRLQSTIESISTGIATEHTSRRHEDRG